MYLYSLYDKQGDRHLSVTMALSDSDFVRSSLFAILMDYPIQDVEFYCLGYFDDQTGLLMPTSPRKGDWNCYRFPEKADSFDEKYLTFEQIRSAALDKKKQFDSDRLDRISDLEKQLIDIDVAIKKETDDDRLEQLKAYRDDVTKHISLLKEKSNE